MPIGRQVQIPFYQPRLPFQGGGGAIQIPGRRSATGGLASAVAQALQGYTSGTEERRERERRERLQPLEEALLRAKVQTAGQPSRTGKRLIKGEETWWIVDPYTGEQKDTGIPISQTSIFGDLPVSPELQKELEEAIRRETGLPTAEPKPKKGIVGKAKGLFRKKKPRKTAEREPGVEEYIEPPPAFGAVWNKLNENQKLQVIEAYYGGKLSKEDLAVIERKLKENPNNISEILRLL